MRRVPKLSAGSRHLLVIVGAGTGDLLARPTVQIRRGEAGAAANGRPRRGTKGTRGAGGVGGVGDTRKGRREGKGSRKK